MGSAVRLLADRCYPSVELFDGLHRHGWRYRLRLKGNLTVDTRAHEATTGVLAEGVTERYPAEVRLFTCGVATNLGILHEAGPEEPWIIAMDCQPTKAVVLDYGARWGIEGAYAIVKRLLGLAYFWCGAQNAVEMQRWATWLLYAVLVDLTDAVAEALERGP